MTTKLSATSNRSSRQIDCFLLSKVAAVVLAAFCYVGWPIHPPLNLPPTNLHEVTGKPTFRDIRTAYVSDTYFFVNDVQLNCSLGLLDGLNGCTYFQEEITPDMPAKAVYYLMPTHIGMRYPVLYSLEQNGKVVVTPQRARASLMRSYDIEWLAYLQLASLFFFVAIALGLIDRANANHKNKRL